MTDLSLVELARLRNDRDEGLMRVQDLLVWIDSHVPRNVVRYQDDAVARAYRWAERRRDDGDGD